VLFQHSSELAIRATLFLAQQAPGKLSPVHEIAAHVGVSEAYLAKILQRLASAGMVRSFRGPGKGMELGRAPDAITLASLIEAMEGAKAPNECVLGLGVCPEENPCPLHEDWIPLRTAIRDLLEKTTLADLVRTVSKGSARPAHRFLGLGGPVAKTGGGREKKESR
jgi:Rrf2 family iron-sulfur cluster assembly transcriptional regulator